jgi:hypothetical protein
LLLLILIIFFTFASPFYFWVLGHWTDTDTFFRSTSHASHLISPLLSLRSFGLAGISDYHLRFLFATGLCLSFISNHLWTCMHTYKHKRITIVISFVLHTTHNYSLSYYSPLLIAIAHNHLDPSHITMLL